MPPLPLIPNQPPGANDINWPAVNPATRNGQTVYTTQGQQGGQQQAPYDYQAVIEAQERYRLESDRNFKLEKDKLDQQKQQIAIQRGVAEANAWYNRELVKLSQQKLEEDRRQFDVGTVEQKRQFDLKQSELSRQFDLTTAEGRRQFEIASAENQRQFSATLALNAGMFDQRQAEEKRQYDLGFGLDQQKFGEDIRQYDLSRADQREQFALSHGLDVRKVEEAARQFDLSRADEMERFSKTLTENRRQFDIGASGYMDDGRATLDREKFQNSALMEWTDRAINLASTPADWIKYKQMTAGVQTGAGQIPGLDWATGGQQGNTAFAGQAQANSLGNVLGQMGVQGGTSYVNPNGADYDAATRAANPGGVPIPIQGRAVDPSGGRGFVPGQEAPQMVSTQGAPAAPQQPTNWAVQAANMVPMGSQLTAKMTGGERQIFDTANEFARNPQGAAAGWLEQLDPITKESIRGAAQAQGHDWETVMSRYNRSRWGAGSGSSMAA